MWKIVIFFLLAIGSYFILSDDNKNSQETIKTNANIESNKGSYIEPQKMVKEEVKIIYSDSPIQKTVKEMEAKSERISLKEKIKEIRKDESLSKQEKRKLIKELRDKRYDLSNPKIKEQYQIFQDILEEIKNDKTITKEQKKEKRREARKKFRKIIKNIDI